MNRSTSQYVGIEIMPTCTNVIFCQITCKDQYATHITIGTVLSDWAKDSLKHDVFASIRLGQ